MVQALLVVAAGMSGCQTVSFYRQAITGQLGLITHQQRIGKLLEAPQTPEPLKERLQLVLRLRAFAEKELRLPVDGHYQKYVDVHREFVVWNVEAAREFSLEPKGWWYPLVGRLEYRGYFSEKAARRYGEQLRLKGYDVYIGGVEAYSTLGWFKDPLLSTFVFHPNADLAETIFHELGHQRVFARGDMDFNEAFATTVGREGTRRWLQSQGDAAACEAYLAEIGRTDQFVRLITKTRAKLEALYGDEQTEEGRIKARKQKSELPPEVLRQKKQQVLEGMQQEYAKLKVQWQGKGEYDEWFAKPVNNAQLNSVAAYYDLVPAFEQLLAANGGNLEKFYEAAESLSKKPKDERHQFLRGDIDAAEAGLGTRR